MKSATVDNLFAAIVDIISAGEIVFSRRSLLSKLGKLSAMDARDRRYINQSLKRVEKRNWVDVIEKNGGIFYRVTPLGAKKVNDHKFKELKISKKDWDGWWRLIIFDIPEARREGRDALRAKLKYLGVYSLQKSVYVYPFDCAKAIMTLADFYDMSDYLEVIQARSLGRQEGDIRKHFGL